MAWFWHSLWILGYLSVIHGAAVDVGVCPDIYTVQVSDHPELYVNTINVCTVNTPENNEFCTPVTFDSNSPEWPKESQFCEFRRCECPEDKVCLPKQQNMEDDIDNIKLITYECIQVYEPDDTEIGGGLIFK